ncbi:MAG: manganese efflux pump [Prevotella sp.]|nr:manganese efflux pump [Prevotella sp.]
MSFWDILLLSVALAMDCFAVSIVCGLSPTPGSSGAGRSARTVIPAGAGSGGVLRRSVLFGVFQAGMPLVGWLATTWLATTWLSEQIEAYDHWVAFGLLAFLGGRMICDAFRDGQEVHQFGQENWWTDIVLAVATSIDALAVGISLAVTGYRTLSSLVLPLVVIGLGSFLFGVLGHLLGMRFGAGIRKRLQPELLGGVILIAIGVKILITHLAS